MDLGLRLWRSGYRALPEEHAQHDDADVVETSLLGRRAVVVRGRAGSELFYDQRVVARHGGIPAAVAGLLFGRGAVHGLDGDDHAERKSMLLSVLAEDRVAPLADAAGEELRRRAARWHGEVVVFDQLVEVYGAAVLAWAGIDCPPGEATRIAHRLAAIVDGFGGAGAAYPRAWAARVWSNRWARRLVEQVRAGTREVAPESALGVIARQGDLSPAVAAVELLNVLRPTVAVAWPATFAVLALARHPEWRPLLTGATAADPADAGRAFGHEVRRTAPFVPALAGRVRADALIGGVRLAPGDRIIFDVPGTNRHPGSWDDPDAFRPDRFASGEPDPFAFVPQGGGDARTGHRCPGEPLTVRLLAETARTFAGLDYEVVSPATFDAERMPTLPARGLLIRL